MAGGRCCLDESRRPGLVLATNRIRQAARTGRPSGLAVPFLFGFPTLVVWYSHREESTSLDWTAAERRKHVAWGKGASFQRATAAPGCGCSTTFSPRRFGGVAAETPRGKVLSGSLTWGYTSLAVARWFTPGYPLSLLRGYPNLITTCILSRTVSLSWPTLLQWAGTAGYCQAADRNWRCPSRALSL